MRLLYRQSTGGFALTKNYAKLVEVPRYAALSHTWLLEEGDDVTYGDIVNGAANITGKPGYQKLEFCAAQAAKDDLQYFWIDSCCIDRANSVELSEAINSMYRWYSRAEKCYALLIDVFASRSGVLSGSRTPQWERDFVDSRWHTRGWCLQELLAPKTVDFYSADGVCLGSKATLQQLITEITNIPREALEGRPLSMFSTQQIMSWANGRLTTRVEDKAYCLLGILGVSMIPNYGEGEKAKARLHEQVSRQERLREGGDLEASSIFPLVLDPNFIIPEGESSGLCLEDTRTELLEKVDEWVERDNSSLVYWFNDVEGTGKSTIARTIAQKYHEKHCLGGNYFFSRGGGDASRADKLFATIAGQLAARIPATRRHIARAVAEDPNILRKSLKHQWEHLIVEPLSRVDDGFGPTAVLFVVDGLDECENERHVRKVLRLLSGARGFACIRLRIFITSRPLAHIRLWFEAIPSTERQTVEQHSPRPDVVKRDLTLFFEKSLNNLHREHSSTSATGLPHGDEIAHLVRLSGGQFVWAAAACRYIRHGKRDPWSRLTKLMRLERLHDCHSHSQLDALYTTVLADCIPDDCAIIERHEVSENLRDLLGHLISLLSPLPAKALENLLDASEGHISQTLLNLRAVFNIPHKADQPIRLHDPAFGDFILDPHRCVDQSLLVDRQYAHAELAKKCIKLMARTLRQNICDLESPGRRTSDINDDRIQRHIPFELQYACLYWAKHLKQAGSHPRDNDEFHDFLQRHFLHWIEALALIRKGPDAGTILRMYQALLDVSIAQTSFA
jgi:hypothetical protein